MKIITLSLLGFALAAMLGVPPTLAQHMPGHNMPGHSMPAPAMPQGSGHAGHGAPSTQAMSPVAKAFAEANAKMMRDMTISLTGNADVDFARGMIPHHQGAIDMAEIVLRFGKDPAVRKLANEIIAAQKKEIAQMQAWLAKNGSQLAMGDSTAVTKAFAEVNARMHKDMTMTFSDNADVDFMKGMVPHHIGAVDMAKVLLQFGRDPELRKLAEDVIRTQNEEIALMNEWLKQNGGAGAHRH
jgi:uncharacterized protein (DUF305 family)